MVIWIIGKVQPESEGFNQDELKRRGDITRRKDSDTPYTGKSFELYDNGQKKWKLNWRDGKPDGLSVWWHPNGKKRREANLKNDELISEKFWNTKGEIVD